MPAPGWLRWTLAVVMVAVALYHLSRLATARRRRVRLPSYIQADVPLRADVPLQAGASILVDIELTHAAMGSAMTVMVLNAVAPSGLRSLGLVFAASMLWFASRAAHSFATAGPRSADVLARQVIGCAAMAYMLLVLAAPSAVAGSMTGAMNGMSMSGAGSSVVSTLSAPAFRMVAVSATIGVAGWTIAHARVRTAGSGPALSLGCQLAVSMTTVYMLVAM